MHLQVCSEHTVDVRTPNSVPAPGQVPLRHALRGCDVVRRGTTRYDAVRWVAYDSSLIARGGHGRHRETNKERESEATGGEGQKEKRSERGGGQEKTDGVHDRLDELPSGVMTVILLRFQMAKKEGGGKE